MWVKIKKSFKVYMLIFVTLLSIFTSSSMGYAAGVPLYNSDYSTTGYGYSISTGYGMTSSWQTVFDVASPSPFMFGGTGSFGITSGYGASIAYVRIYGSNDNANWVQVASSGYQPGTFTWSLGPSAYYYLRVDICWTNSGSYGQNYSFQNQVYGVAADQNTVQSALDAANAANQAAQATVSYAQNASTQASNASSYASQALNWLNGTWGGYNLGTVGTNATTAMNNSATANNYLTNGTYGLSAINTNVLNTQSGINSLQTSTNNIQTGVNNLQTTANNLQNSVNNITNVMPPILNKVSGYNGATATSSSRFNVSLDYTNANEYSYMIDGGSWSTWTSLSSHDTLGYFTASGISGTGTHTIYVQIRNNASGQVSPVAKGKVIVFKI